MNTSTVRGTCVRVETRVRAHSVPVAACMVACALWELSPFPLRVGGRFRGFRRARLVRLKPVHSVSQGKPTWRPPARTTGCRCSRAIWTPMPLAHSTRRASHRPPLGVSPDTPKFVIPMCTVKTHTEGVGRTVLYRTPPRKRQGGSHTLVLVPIQEIYAYAASACRSGHPRHSQESP